MQHHSQQHHSEYRPPTLAVDLVAFRVHAGVLEVLLMRRRNEPFAGEWALPGGYNAQGETTMEALSRVARTKVGVNIDADLGFVEQLYTFDTTARDPRGMPCRWCTWAAGLVWRM